MCHIRVSTYPKFNEHDFDYSLILTPSSCIKIELKLPGTKQAAITAAKSRAPPRDHLTSMVQGLLGITASVRLWLRLRLAESRSKNKITHLYCGQKWFCDDGTSSVKTFAIGGHLRSDCRHCERTTRWGSVLSCWLLIWWKYLIKEEYYYVM